MDVCELWSMWLMELMYEGGILLYAVLMVCCFLSWSYVTESQGNIVAANEDRTFDDSHGWFVTLTRDISQDVKGVR